LFAAHILARNTGSSADNMAALQLPRSSGWQPGVGKAGGGSRSESPGVGEAAGDLEMGARLHGGSSDGDSSSSPDMQQQQGQRWHSQQHQQQQGQEQGQEQSVLQRLSAVFGLGRLPRKQSSSTVRGNGSGGSRLQTQLSPVYSLGDEADEAAALTEGTELLHERA
jgi:hypothetical protein